MVVDISSSVQVVIRHAERSDAMKLSELRFQIDGETENLDREQGEGYIDEAGFQKLIQQDTDAPTNLFLVAEVEGKLVGFSRCEGTSLKRLAHKVEFGVCVLQLYWGYGIGTAFLKESIEWAGQHGVRKIQLSVVETNSKAIALYKRYGFEVEGLLKKDKRLSDGHFYDTVVMGRFTE